LTLAQGKAFAGKLVDLVGLVVRMGSVCQFICPAAGVLIEGDADPRHVSLEPNGRLLITACVFPGVAWMGRVMLKALVLTD
jgi:hypothetical protein